MTNWMQAHRRLLTSARILKAFYESKLQMDVELLTEAPTPPLETDVSFAPSVTGYGIWGLRPSKPLAPGVHEEISDMCEGILGGLEEMDVKREALERMQMQMEKNLNGEIPSNVIVLHRKPAVRAGRMLSSAPHKTYMLKLDCLIEAVTTSEVHKMAMELHSQGSRMAFVDYSELEPLQRQSLSHLMALGSITLYVPDILALNAYEQEIFRHLIQQTTLSRPLLMVGSVKPYSELRGEPAIDDEFLTLLARAYIKLTRPFSEYKEQGLIHYFLDSLSSNPT